MQTSLLFTLFMTSSPFLIAEIAAFLGFGMVPTGEIVIPAVAIISIILAIWLLWRVRK